MATQILTYSPHLLEHSAKMPFQQQSVTIQDYDNVSVILPAAIEITPAEQHPDPEEKASE